MRIREGTIVDTPGIARVHVESWRTAYRGLVPARALDGLSFDARAQIWHERLADPRRDRFALVAEDDDSQIVGVLLGGRERDESPRFEGTVAILYLLPSVQRRGIGRTLMRAAAERLAVWGISSLCVWVFKENPARRFYEALGGVPIREQPADLSAMLADVPEPIVLTEVLYGWDDIGVLLR